VGSDPVDRSRRPVVLVPYWDFFERSTDEDLRASRAARLEQLRPLLAQATEAGPELWVDGAEAGAEAGVALRSHEPSVIVVLQTMAVPPAWVTAALDAVPEAPVLVVVAQGALDPSAAYDHGDIVREGGTVGAAQLTNALVRRGRPFRLLAGTLGEPDTDARVIFEARAAHAAGRLRGARLLRLGAPIEGYECVDCDAAELAAATGIELVELHPARLRDAYLAVAEAEAEPLATAVEEEWEVAPAARRGDAFGRSMRLAIALERLSREHGADGGALNCHVEEIRLGADPGIAPCFALGRETSAGRPWTCTGDVVTAVAMLTLKLLGAPAWYHEVEALDAAGDEALLACSGEHDLGLAPPGERPELRPNPWWDGVCACFTPPPGPASLVGFTPAAGARGGFRFVVAEGAFTGRRLPATGTVNGGFSFAAGTAREAWEGWVRAGANHHAAATSGHRAASVAAVAEQLGVECIVV
jgi:L-arabinose isomerase